VPVLGKSWQVDCHHVLVSHLVVAFEVACEILSRAGRPLKPMISAVSLVWKFLPYEISVPYEIKDAVNYHIGFRPAAWPE
jgi:hypothetical protein